MSQHFANSLEDLHAIATIFFSEFPNGGIFKIHGAMGAGKTTFVSALCAARRVEIDGSPTFGIVNEYEIDADIYILHYDLYRLRSFEELLDIGMQDLLDKKGYHFIEWPEIAAPLLDDAHDVFIEENNGVRTIAF